MEVVSSQAYVRSNAPGVAHGLAGQLLGGCIPRPASLPAHMPADRTVHPGSSACKLMENMILKHCADLLVCDSLAC